MEDIYISLLMCIELLIAMNDFNCILIGRSAEAGAGYVVAGVEGAEERAQAVRAEERGGGLNHVL